MADAVDDGLLAVSPVPRLTRRRSGSLPRSNSDPLTVAEVKSFLAAVPAWYCDLYDVWFRVGWRPSEILAIRFDWLDFTRQTVLLKRGRIPRQGGLEAPATGPGDRIARRDTGSGSDAGRLYAAALFRLG